MNKVCNLIRQLVLPGRWPGRALLPGAAALAWLLLGAVAIPPVHAAAAASGVGHGAGGGAGGLLSVDPGMAFFTLIIFILLVTVLGRYAWRPLLRGLQQREQAIRQSVQAAAEAHARVEQTRRQLEEKIAEVQREAALELQQAKQDASRAAQTIHQQAQAESKALKEQALRDIEAARRQALDQIAVQAVDLSVAIASRILEREVNPTDRQKLLDESLTQLSDIAG